MARQFQLRGDTQKHWTEANPVLADREFILISTNPLKPTTYDQSKIGDGIHHYIDLPFRGLPAVQQRGNSPIDIMSQKAVTQEIEILEKNLAKLQASGGDIHKQNTDEGTDSTSFYIHRIRLENCHNGLELRNWDDTDFDDMTLRNLIVKGKLIVDKGITETEIEEIKARSNLIVLNEGETGEGVTRGFSGIAIDRGTGEYYMILFDESDDSLKAGFSNDLNVLAFRKDVIRKDQLKVVSELPETAEDGDLYIIPTEEEEETFEDFLTGYIIGIERTVNYIDLQSICKKGDENWADNTIVITAKATYPVKSEIHILLKYPDESWLPLITLAPEETTFEFAAHEIIQGTKTDLKLESELSDDYFVYAIPRYINIAKPEEPNKPDEPEKS